LRPDRQGRFTAISRKRPAGRRRPNILAGGAIEAALEAKAAGKIRFIELYEATRFFDSTVQNPDWLG
jgi:hypothetical protein